MATDAELQTMFDACDANLTAMDKYLGKATERMAVKDYKAAQANISAAHAQLGDAGATLAALHDECIPQAGTPPPVVEPPPITPPQPPQGDSLDAFRARQSVSQNCAWVQLTGGEASALDAKIGATARAQYVAFYTIGGSGGLGAFEAPDAGSPSGYSFQDWSAEHGGASTHDVNQAADVAVQWFATQQGRMVPPPVVV